MASNCPPVLTSREALALELSLIISALSIPINNLESLSEKYTVAAKINDVRVVQNMIGISLKFFYHGNETIGISGKGDIPLLQYIDTLKTRLSDLYKNAAEIFSETRISAEEVKKSFVAIALMLKYFDQTVMLEKEQIRRFGFKAHGFQRTPSVETSEAQRFSQILLNEIEKFYSQKGLPEYLDPKTFEILPHDIFAKAHEHYIESVFEPFFSAQLNKP